MPMYDHICRKCKIEMTVLRSYDEYRDPPRADDPATEENLRTNADKTPCPDGEHDWEKLLGTGIKMMRGSGWRGSKGNW